MRRNSLFQLFWGFLMGASLSFGLFVLTFDSKVKFFKKNDKAMTTVKKTPTTTPDHLTTKGKTTTTACPVVNSAAWTVFETAIQSVQAERQTVLRNSCRSLKKKDCFSFLKTPNPNAMVSKTYPLSVCEIYKCGSTSWLLGLLTIDELYAEAEALNVSSPVLVFGLDKMRVKTNRNATMQQQFWDNAVNIITVRNPFERIVSAYLDKMIPGSEGFTYVFGPMSKRIWRKFRHLRANPLERNSTDDVGTASFEDFVHALIEEKHDAHWTRYNVKCSPCIYHYDYIIKFETLQSDIAYLENRLKFSKEHRNVLFANYRQVRTKNDVVNEHFKKVPKALAQKLYEVYRVDFESFGYSKPSFIC